MAIAPSQRETLEKTLAWRHGWGRFWTAVMCFMGAIALVPLLAIVGYVLVRGLARLDAQVWLSLTPAAGQAGGGLGNAILGSGVMVTLATAISVPLGVAVAIYLAEVARSNWIAVVLRLAVNVLNGMPSILLGVFVYGAVVVGLGWGFSAIAGALSLTLVMLPTIIRTTDDQCQALPMEQRLGAYALGATDWEVITGIVLPAVLPAIVTGAMLAISRAAGETAPLIFTALGFDFWLQSLQRPAPALSLTIYRFATGFDANQQNLAWTGALILLGLVLITNLVARWLQQRFQVPQR
ncbi:MAG: phosphate ABC transporter permease PstA [Oscillatoriales cyanobacterium SM2_2_1]|nr:phosphate ABC transporter permease PstA [Oscillatoriales cyanobacterium SM2_2_1]